MDDKSSKQKKGNKTDKQEEILEKEEQAEVETKKDNRDALIEELTDQLKRAVADYKNLERRFDEERRETIRYANKELIESLLPAFDALFLAGKYTEDQGVKLTIQRIVDILKENGIEKIPTENVEYNASSMECVEVVEGAEGKVIEELRPGFTINGKLIRPAQVKVGGTNKSE